LEGTPLYGVINALQRARCEVPRELWFDPASALATYFAEHDSIDEPLLDDFWDRSLAIFAYRVRTLGLQSVPISDGEKDPTAYETPGFLGLGAVVAPEPLLDHCIVVDPGTMAVEASPDDEVSGIGGLSPTTRWVRVLTTTVADPPVLRILSPIADLPSTGGRLRPPEKYIRVPQGSTRPIEVPIDDD